MFMSGTVAKGQLVEGLYRLYQPGVPSYQPTDTSGLSHLGFFTPGSTSFSMDLGTGYTSFGRGAGFSSSYISPMVTFTPTERLQLRLGGRFSSSNMGSMPSAVTPQATQAQGMGIPTEAFVSGRYLLSSRLSVYGEGFFGQNQMYYSPISRQFGSTDYQHVSFGMDYKVGERFTIGASFGYTNGPVWGSPYGGRNRFHSPFPF